MASERLRVIFGHIEYLPHKSVSFYKSNKSKNEGIQRFQYTMDNPKLTMNQRVFYEENGYLLIKNLVKHEYLDRWRQRFMDLIEGRAYSENMTKMKDVSLKDRTDISPERIINKIQDFVWDEVLSEHSRLPEATDRIVCAWTAMEKVHRDNGCLFVVPGSHKGKLEQHEYPNWEKGVNKMYHGVRGFDDVPKQLLEMEKGDTVFFHPVLLHGSGDNVTNHFRKAISCHFAASDCYYIDVKGTLQENIEKEVKEIAKRKGMEGLDFGQIWNLRSRLVRGREITL
ncbi:Phytanoyl-CoA dioxygenase, peroxisomal [Armadillidium nasatum]|uniref:phytanoyl-CoA dioxygenase n=1 Tax=Armadillidium nasatum TaxID=96803 RepID=A0A5N5TDQ7_9CRUS|nr:Phytanoyl-CoA dioxygenase, peroxisomal [Armadillidium nasatum]